MKKVYALEEQVIRLLEKQVLPLLPGECLKEDVEMKLLRNPQEDITVIEVTAEKGKFYLCSKYEGKDSKLKTSWVSKEIHEAQMLSVADGNLTNQLASQVA